MWIECRAVFERDGERLDYEAMGIPEPEDNYTWELFTFNTKEMEAFNLSNNQLGTTINFKSGFRITTDLDYSEFKKYFIIDN